MKNERDIELKDGTFMTEDSKFNSTQNDKIYTPKDDIALMKTIDELEIQDAVLDDIEPMQITNAMVDRPCLFICSCYVIMLACLVFSAQAGYFQLSTSKNREYLIWDHPMTEAWDKIVLAEDYLKAGGSKEKPIQMTQKSEWNPIVLFESTDGESLLTKKNLERIE